MYQVLVLMLCLIQSPSPSVESKNPVVHDGTSTSRKGAAKNKSESSLPPAKSQDVGVPRAPQAAASEGDKQPEPPERPYKVDVVTPPPKPQDTPLFPLYLWLTGGGVFVNALIWFLILRQTKLNLHQLRINFITAKAAIRSARAAKVSAESAHQTVEHLEKQFPELKRSADAAHASAEAALLNAQVVLASERAWVFFELKQYGENTYQVIFTNHGRTPAQIIVVHFKWTFADSPGGTLPDTPDYGLNTEFVHAKVLPPGEPWEHFEYRVAMSPTNLTEPGFKMVAEGRRRFFIWGRIRYQDVVGNKDIHESRFCYMYSNVLGAFIPGGPGIYTGYS